ncbi:MAG: hypothetical protein JXA73_01920 [Acidobacteria bacterium]|nr:hypothetical protein [Acidobacteriota bacterium]
MRNKRLCLELCLAFIFLPAFCPAQEEPQLTREQQRQFLLKAKVIRHEQLSKGITRSYRLTLSDGVITHKAHFQSINERRGYKELDRGGEINFVDSYLYNIAACELSELLGLEGMIPVTVERKWERKIGALAWWLPSQMTEGERREKKITPPDLDAFNELMHKVQVFCELICDTDRWNPGNILIGNNWEVYMVDFSRAFRLYHDLKKPEKLVRCSRKLLENLRALDEKALTEKVGSHLNDLEIKGIMKRRDKIVAHFEKLIAEKGEGAVLY